MGVSISNASRIGLVLNVWIRVRERDWELDSSENGGLTQSKRNLLLRRSHKVGWNSGNEDHHHPIFQGIRENKAARTWGPRKQTHWGMPTVRTNFPFKAFQESLAAPRRSWEKTTAHSHHSHEMEPELRAAETLGLRAQAPVAKPT